MSATRLFLLCWAGLCLYNVDGVDRKMGEKDARKLSAEGAVAGAAAGAAAGKWPFSVASDEAEEFPVRMNSETDTDEEESARAPIIRRGHRQGSAVVTPRGNSDDSQEDEEDSEEEEVILSDDAFEVDDSRSGIITDDNEEEEEDPEAEERPAAPKKLAVHKQHLTVTRKSFPGCTPATPLVGPSYARQIQDSQIMTNSIYNGRPFTNNATFSRIDDVTTSYCGGLYWDKSQNPPGWLHPNGTCYLMYNFGNPMWIQGFVTAGRNDAAATWVTNFAFFQSQNGLTWSEAGPSFPGNVDAIHTETNLFTSPIRAPWAMIVGTETESIYPVPAGSTVKRCCFRAELIGCYAETSTTTVTTTTTTTTLTTTRTTTTRQNIVVGATIAPLTTPTSMATTAMEVSNISNVSNVSNNSASYSRRGMAEIFTLLGGLALSFLGPARFANRR